MNDVSNRVTQDELALIEALENTRLIEETKQEEVFDPSNPNVDQMTYEELLEMEEINGKVSKGLTPKQIQSIPEKTWKKKGDTTEATCSICFEDFEKWQMVKETKC